MPTNSFETLIFEKKDGLAYVTLNRPEALNVFNVQMRDDLFEILSALRDDDEVRVVIFKGAGKKAFCAGSDLSEFLTAPSPVIARQVRFERDVWGLFLELSQPLIAALHGYVLGSGLEIALCCDIRIGSDDVRFGLPEVGLGLIPAAGGTQTVPRILKQARALEMLLANRWIDAKEAHQAGLVNQVVPENKLVRTAEALAGKIVSFDPEAVRYAKQAIVRSRDLSLAEGLELEKRLVLMLQVDKLKRKVSQGSN